MAVEKLAGKDRSYVMDQVNKLDRNKTVFTASLKEDISEWDVSPGNFKLTINGTPYHFRNWARSQVLRKLRIPAAYFDICSEELRNRELEEGFANLSRGVENQFKVWINPETNEPQIYGIIPTNCIDALTGEYLEKVFDGLGSLDNTMMGEMDLTLESLRMRFYDKEKALTANVDDLFPGVDFKFSEVLKTPIALQSLIWRKQCSNGLVVPDKLNSSFVMPLTRFKPDVFNMNIQFVESANSGLDQIAKTFDALKQIELPEALLEPDLENKTVFDEVFEYVLPSRSLRSDFGQTIRAEYNREENLTANGLVNAVTRVARDLEDDNNKISLETAAGTFVSLITQLDNAAQARSEQLEYNKEMLDRKFKKPKKIHSAGNMMVGHN